MLKCSHCKWKKRVRGGSGQQKQTKRKWFKKPYPISCLLSSHLIYLFPPSRSAPKIIARDFSFHCVQNWSGRQRSVFSQSKYSYKTLVLWFDPWEGKDNEAGGSWTINHIKISNSLEPFATPFSLFFYLLSPPTPSLFSSVYNLEIFCFTWKE